MNADQDGKSAAGGPRRIMAGGFYNPHLGAEILKSSVPIDHLAMADPPHEGDPFWSRIKDKYTLLLHDYLGQLSEPFDERSIQRSLSLAEMYGSPWVAEHFQCLHTTDGAYNLNYVFPPLYTQEFLDRFIENAKLLASRLKQPLVMENIPGFFDVKTSQMPEPEWLRLFFEATGVGFLLDLPHIWLQAHYKKMPPKEWLEQFPLEHVWEIHVAGVEDDEDLQGPWIAPVEPNDQMLEFMNFALQRCPKAKAVTFDAFSPSVTAEAMFRTITRMRDSLRALLPNSSN